MLCGEVGAAGEAGAVGDNDDDGGYLTPHSLRHTCRINRLRFAAHWISTVTCRKPPFPDNKFILLAFRIPRTGKSLRWLTSSARPANTSLEQAMIGFRKQVALGCILAVATMYNTSHAFVPLNRTVSILSQNIPLGRGVQTDKLEIMQRAGHQQDNNVAPLEATKSGRIVEMEISNLDGEEGKTGIVRIQLRKDWAPLGVERFEVGEKQLQCCN